MGKKYKNPGERDKVLSEQAIAAGLTVNSEQHELGDCGFDALFDERPYEELRCRCQRCMMIRALQRETAREGFRCQ